MPTFPKRSAVVCPGCNCSLAQMPPVPRCHSDFSCHLPVNENGKHVWPNTFLCLQYMGKAHHLKPVSHSDLAVYLHPDGTFDCGTQALTGSVFDLDEQTGTPLSFASTPKHSLNFCLCFPFGPITVGEAANILHGSSNSSPLILGWLHPFCSNPYLCDRQNEDDKHILNMVTMCQTLKSKLRQYWRAGQSSGDNDQAHIRGQLNLWTFTVHLHGVLLPTPVVVTKMTREEWVVLVVWKYTRGITLSTPFETANE